MTPNFSDFGIALLFCKDLFSEIPSDSCALLSKQRLSGKASRLRMLVRISDFRRLLYFDKIMPSTRSASRAIKVAGGVSAAETPLITSESTARKRKVDGADIGVPKKPKRTKPVNTTKVEHSAIKFTLDIEPDAQVIPAKLAFSFEEAKAHLIDADPRFEELFQRVKCRPFEELEPVDPFRCAFVNSADFDISNSNMPEHLLYPSCLYALFNSFSLFLTFL